MIYRALIRTHHMTSRKKIQSISRAAKKYDCGVYLKTGSHPPGVMIAEYECGGGEAGGLKEWINDIKRLRYKDYHLLKFEAVEFQSLNVAIGHVKEFDSMKALVEDLTRCEIVEWWQSNMTFIK